MNVITKPASFELVMKREIAAPRERVFAAWTDVRQSMNWWAPRDFTILSCEMDVRPGGTGSATPLLRTIEFAAPLQTVLALDRSR